MVAVVGDVDEANSAIGVALAAMGQGGLLRTLLRIQNELFDLGADLATPHDMPGTEALRVTPAQVQRLEADIDALNADLDPLRSFVLPGGTAAAAALHLARATVRRAERTAVAAANSRALNVQAIIYINRLSDFLFVAARHVNKADGGDVLWEPGATR